MTDDLDATLRPTTLDEYIGQDRMKATLNVLAATAVADDAPLPHLLFTGPPGCGKTTLALALAQSVGDPLFIVRKPLPAERFLRVLKQHGGGIIFVDELQDWPKPMQADFLSLCDEERIFEGRFGTYQFPNLTIIGATTDEHRLRGPLVSRFIVPPFEEYTADEMADIVAGMAMKLGVELDDPMCEALGAAAGGVPRQAKHLVTKARGLLIANKAMPTVDEVLDFAQVSADGLTRRHMDYLRALLMLGSDSGIANIARMMQAPEELAKGCERLLLRLGLIQLGRGGRVLTFEGEQRVAGTPARLQTRSQRRERLTA